uniref:Nuclear transcription factor Y subunit n=1 Tax=Macrostomum lignano TaxID=282301 RepID=A0A1I8HIF7_9PLAT
QQQQHCPTLPMPQSGEAQHRPHTLLRLGGGPDASNAYYRIPASDEDSGGYDRGGGGIRRTPAATIDGRRAGRRASSGQRQQQPPAYQTLMQHQQQQQQQQQPHIQQASEQLQTLARPHRGWPPVLDCQAWGGRSVGHGHESWNSGPSAGVDP